MKNLPINFEEIINQANKKLRQLEVVSDILNDIEVQRNALADKISGEAEVYPWEREDIENGRYAEKIEAYEHIANTLKNSYFE